MVIRHDRSPCSRTSFFVPVSREQAGPAKNSLQTDRLGRKAAMGALSRTESRLSQFMESAKSPVKRAQNRPLPSDCSPKRSDVMMHLHQLCILGVNLV